MKKVVVDLQDVLDELKVTLITELKSGLFPNATEEFLKQLENQVEVALDNVEYETIVLMLSRDFGEHVIETIVSVLRGDNDGQN